MIIKNVEGHWARLSYPAQENKFGAYNYELQVKTADKATADSLREFGVTVKEDEGVYTANLKKKGRNRAGENLKAPKVVRADLSEMDNAEIQTIGNGTIMNVQLRSYDWEFGGRKGTSVAIEGVQVVKMAHYQGGADLEFDIHSVDL